jgi:hypothetical protein
MKKYAVLASLLSLSLSAYAEFFVEQGQIKAEVQTYTKEDKKIVLIDMVHVGPKSFYKAVSSTMKRYEKSNAVILQEGVRHCQNTGDVYMLPGETANFKVLEELYEQRFISHPDSAREELLAAGFMEKKCQYDEVIRRPDFLERLSGRFSLYGVVAGVGLLRSQGTIANLYPKSIKLSSGDIATAKFTSVVEKAAAGSIVQCLLTLKAKGGCVPFKEWSKTDAAKAIQDEIILNRRNDILLGITFNTLNLTSDFGLNYSLPKNLNQVDTIILPWGAAHMPSGLIEAIENMGFIKAKKEGVVYTSCERFKKNIIINAILNNQGTIKSDCQ